MENWKSINGYELIYEVSDLGRVKRVCSTPSYRKNKILKNKKKPNGYLFVGLSKNRNVKYFHIHRLVAKHFMENTEDKPCVNHKDLNKENNTVSNLEWVTHKENSQHAIKNLIFNRNPLRGVDNKNSTQVVQYLNGKEVYIWESYSCAAKHYSVTSACISKAITRNNVSIGFTWRKCSMKYYLKTKNKYKTPPKLLVDKTKRDMSKARIKKREINTSKYTHEFLIKEGIKCFRKNKSLKRIVWDEYAKNNKILTYVPVSNRFNGFSNFKRTVLSNI